MNTKHTPGLYVAHGATVYQADNWKEGNNLGGQCVALCYQPMADESPSEEQFANAQFLASAPELLAALEKCAEYFASIDAFNPVKKHGCVGDEVRNLARAAIGKATL